MANKDKLVADGEILAKIEITQIKKKRLMWKKRKNAIKYMRDFGFCTLPLGRLILRPLLVEERSRSRKKN